MTTLEKIKSRCEEVADCWIWQGYTTQTGYPMAKIGGKVQLVRRVVCELDGRKPAPRQPVASTCNEKRCCNPEHTFPSTIQAVAKAAAKRGAFSTLSRRAKIAATKRAAGKLTMDKATEIRLRTEPAHMLAPIYGVDKSLIVRVRAGKAWRDLSSSPFAGLGQRAA